MYRDSTRTLLSYKDIRHNGFNVETRNDNKGEYLFITKSEGYAKQLLEKISSTSSGLYYTYIKPVHHVAYKINYRQFNWSSHEHFKISQTFRFFCALHMP
jgi:hypothetical protein